MRQRQAVQECFWRSPVMTLPIPVPSTGLLAAFHIVMTFAWHGHLRFKQAALPMVVLVSRGIAFIATGAFFIFHTWG